MEFYLALASDRGRRVSGWEKMRISKSIPQSEDSDLNPQEKDEVINGFSGWEAVGLTEKRRGSTIFLFVCFGGSGRRVVEGGWSRGLGEWLVTEGRWWSAARRGRGGKGNRRERKRGCVWNDGVERGLGKSLDGARSV
ncbi:hypothetical protein HAX54_001287 [Datura stramonium]|uniref:Uncharacterized protein n=1 Tax=Datura stramonium TaxID=4076 RepID=A0ABS8RUN6_DATST|nr:hypothetical protein [Datura stramonium]